MRLFRAAE